MAKLPPRVERKAEANVSGEVRTYLGTVPGLVHWLNPVGGAHALSGHWVTYGLCDGSADIIACVPTSLRCPSCAAPLPPVGRFVGIETKHPTTGRRGPLQEAWQAVVTRAHGVSGFARSPIEAADIVRRARILW